MPTSVLSMISLNLQNNGEGIILAILVTEPRVDELSHFAHSPHSLKEF